MAGILVIAEAANGALAPISGELIGAAKKLSAEGAGSVTALVAGDAALAQGLIAAGADNAIAATSANLATGTADAYVPAVEAALAQSGADIILLGQTSLGRDLGPALAFKLGMLCLFATIVGLSVYAHRRARKRVQPVPESGQNC